MIPALIGDTLTIAFLTYAIFYAGRLVWRSIVERRESEPETHGDNGGVPHEVCRRAAAKVTRDRVRGMPAPADYSDEVTDEHFTQIAELVDQGKFENAEVVSGPAWIKYERAG